MTETRPLRPGDRVRAVPGSTSALWAEGSVGVIAEVRDRLGGNNLVRWEEGTGILMGFKPDDVEPE